MSIKATMEELMYVQAIAARAADYIEKNFDVDYDTAYSITHSDIMIVHEDIVPLKLKELAEHSEEQGVDFYHDIFGIRKHLKINDDGFELTRCFLPRYADLKRLDTNFLI